MSINRVILVGSLGQDPKIGETNSGLKYGSFSLATSDSYKDKKTGEKKTDTEWHNISCFGSIVNALQYIGKGSKVYLEGKIKSEEYTDKNTGESKRAYKILCDKIEIIKGKEDNQNKPNSHQEAKQNGYQPQAKGLVKPVIDNQEIVDDTVPF
jgi:single-strand DNA-binding protein